VAMNLFTFRGDHKGLLGPSTHGWGWGMARQGGVMWLW